MFLATHVRRQWCTISELFKCGAGLISALRARRLCIVQLVSLEGEKFISVVEVCQAVSRKTERVHSTITWYVSASIREQQFIDDQVQVILLEENTGATSVEAGVHSTMHFTIRFAAKRERRAAQE